MLVSMSTPSEAPGRLEQVRTFLNTWRIPHETRLPTDVLPTLACDRKAWEAELPDLSRPAEPDLDELARLREDLRGALGQHAPESLRPWLVRHPVTATIGRPVVYMPDNTGTAGDVLALVVEALAAEQWARLKACPDCRNVFFDHSRNRSRTWCSMYAETPDGRACGSIAKVRAYRSRRQQST